jgi:hypothetical protein
MSAYICNDSVFATLGAFAALTLGAQPQAAADLLKAENIRSVNHRYNDNTPVTGADLTKAEPAPDRGCILELCGELEYQSCETEDYRSRPAFLLLTRIRSAAVAHVPGDKTASLPGSLVGAPVYRDRDGSRGYIVNTWERDSDMFTLGSGGMSPLSRSMVDIVWLPDESGKGLQRQAEPINRAQPMIDSRYNWPPISPAQAERLAAEQEAEHAAFVRAATLQREEQERKEAAFRAELAAVMPADCKGVIIAELLENECDSMSDYFGSRTARRLILGFSTHNRNNFAEMRKALRAADIADLPELAALADPEQSEEERENYTGGSGYYLQAAGASHYGGWKVKKVRSYRDNVLTADGVGVGELRLPNGSTPDPEPRKRKPEPTSKAQPEGISVRLNAEKQGIEVVFSSKPGEEVRAQLKAHGFRWSRRAGLWYAKQTPERLEFAQQLAGADLQQVAA